MNNPFYYIPSEECNEAFRLLLSKIDSLRECDDSRILDFCRELDEGKMLGVLIAEDSAGDHHTLYAFSGQMGDNEFSFPGFVEPVFDYLQPDGYFRTQEASIAQLTQRIVEFEGGEYAQSIRRHKALERQLKIQLDALKKHNLSAKEQRRQRRESGACTSDELEEMIRQSQFEKAELHRLKLKLRTQLQPLQDEVQRAEAYLLSLKDERRKASEGLQHWLFDNFKVLNAHGVERSLSRIFADTALRVPPSGAGECCAPKLLQVAYLNGWTPVSIAEYWYGKPKNGEVRRHGDHYPACRGKCLPILTWMLQGLNIEPPLESVIHSDTEYIPEILFENEYFCVVNKPSGMLSVPGKGALISVQDWLAEYYGDEKCVHVAHRLDQDTSGLIIATFGDQSYRLMQKLFAARRVQKTYIAILEGDYRLHDIADRGVIDLPLSADWLDRPRQRVDLDSGKEAVTEYEFLSVERGRSRVAFYPRTGRTHQLRVHAASEAGLGMPIAGDRLYGISAGKEAERLMLHAHKLMFRWPLDNVDYSFEVPVPF